VASHTKEVPPSDGAPPAGSDSNPAKENGRLKYLLFDLTLDPRLIAEKMIEGVNIPGPGVPIPIDSSRLPNGWEKRVIQRGIGITKGKWDVFIQNANGRSFRSVSVYPQFSAEISCNLHISVWKRFCRK
jgi:hypothetical protein